MINAVLHHFTPHTHPLILVSDRDGLLNEETILTELLRRGFTLIDEPDPVRLRYRISTLPPCTAQQPLIVVTAGALNALPYDLWQRGHRVTLDLHAFFPNLAYPVVRSLSPAQRRLLSLAPSPPRRLGPRRTADFVLRHVFAADPEALRQPAQLVLWLDRYHRQANPMPSALSDRLLTQLRKVPAYAEWPLNELLVSHKEFIDFVSEQWGDYIKGHSTLLAGEGDRDYLLNFGSDPALQDALPTLVRSGTLTPTSTEQHDSLPDWAQPAVLAPDQDSRARRIKELLALLSESAEMGDARWQAWQVVARAWAELSLLVYAPDARLDDTRGNAFRRIQTHLDAAFLDWLQRRYAPLAGQRLPRPHHLFHVPHYIAYQRRQQKLVRVALLILDGLALADWLHIRSTWRERHPNWTFAESLVLAQVPTITSISRQALVSGLRPAEFAHTLDTNRQEPQHWAAFWAREDLPPEACPCVHLALDQRKVPPEIDSVRVQALCLIDRRVDELVHDATQGSKDFYASLRIWLDEYGRHVEDIVSQLLGRGFAVYLASDHGHTQARGFGYPSQGLMVDTRGRRARIYSHLHAAINAQQGYEAVLWRQDGLLPDDIAILLPRGRAAFETYNKTVVTHGGLTLDEVIVPLVAIIRK
jgi:hypothetical protein